MKLCEHPEFVQAILRSSEHFRSRGLRPALIEEDYYDLAQLVLQPEVDAMLSTHEYGAIKADYDGISRSRFPQSYFAPPDMSFARSDALFPSDTLVEILGRDYETQCRALCIGPYPAWREVLARFERVRDRL